MKHTIIVLLSSLIIVGCKVNPMEPDHEARQAVRDYLAEKGYGLPQELEWGSLDSVFSRYDMDAQYQDAKDRYERRLSLINLQMSYTEDSKQLRAFTDSAYAIQYKLYELSSDYSMVLKEAKPNRLGISLLFKYPVDPEAVKFTFVLSDDKTVDHVISDWGNAFILPEHPEKK